MAKTLTKEFYRKGFKTVFKYLRPHQSPFFVLMVLSVVAAMGHASTPYLMGRLFDSILGKKPSVNLAGYSLPFFAVILGVWLLVRIITDILEWIKSDRQEKLAAIIEADYLVHAFSKLLLFPLSFHKKNKMGDVVQRIGRAAGWLENITFRVLVGLAPDFFSIFIAIAISFTIKPVLALLLIGALFIYIILMVRIAPQMSHVSGLMHRAYSRAYGDANDSILNVQAVKAATAEEYEKKKFFRNFHLRAAKLWVDYIRMASHLSFSQRIIVTLTQFFLFAVSVYFIRQGQMTIGELVAFNGYAAMLFGPFVILGRNWDVIQNGLVAIERSEEILRKPEEIYTPRNEIILQDIKGEVEFRDVSFRYGRNRDDTLKNISFKIKAGEVVALVGESGVGKTTLIDLLSLYHGPSQGKIFIDGHNITSIGLARLRSFMAIVPQEILLFNDTIKNNIRYGRFDADDGEIQEAARMAHADEFIESFSKKYDQIVGERGIKLSAGQKQRIAIARAILRDPRILILDEPTSALDAKSEKYIQESLEVLMRGRTTFIIAHRLSTVRKADMILVLDKGEISESGTHEKLIKFPSGIYRKLYDLQIGLK